MKRIAIAGVIAALVVGLLAYVLVLDDTDEDVLSGLVELSPSTVQLYGVSTAGVGYRVVRDPLDGAIETFVFVDNGESWRLELSCMAGGGLTASMVNGEVAPTHNSLVSWRIDDMEAQTETWRGDDWDTLYAPDPEALMDALRGANRVFVRIEGFTIGAVGLNVYGMTETDAQPYLDGCPPGPTVPPGTPNIEIVDDPPSLHD